MSAIALQEISASCIGREQELSRLRDRYEEASRHGERLVLVRGPAGVGKTRLMVEFRSRMRLDGAVVLEGRCTPGARALAPLGEILRRALNFLEDVGRSAEIDLAPVSFLLGDSPPVELDSEGASWLVRRANFFESYCSLLRGLSRIKPPIIVVHDLQWADPATVELLNHLLDGAGPWLHAPQNDRTLYGLIVASTRSGEGSRAVGRLADHPKAEAMDLGGFDAAAMTEFLGHPKIIQKLLAVTGGNPEKLEALLDSAGSSAERMFQRRTDSLSPEAARLLAALAVLGRPSEAGLVARVAEVSNVARPLAELVREGMVVKSIQEGEVLLRLGRHRYGDVMVEGLGPQERRALHQRVVDCFKGSRGLAAQDVAIHAIRARDRATAVTAALEASYALERTYAYEAAAKILEDAQPLADEARAVELNLRLIELYRHMGEYDRALERAAMVLRARPADPSARLTMGRLRVLAGDYDSAAEALERVVAPGDEADPSLLAELAAARSEVSYRRGNYDEALALCSSPPADTNPATRIALCNTRGKIELAQGRYQAARTAFEANLETARASGLIREQAQALINLGIVELREHRHDAAEARMRESLELSRRTGDLREAALALENLAILAHFRRDYATALECYHAAVADLKHMGNRAMLARAANNLGELYLRLADHRRAGSLAAFARQMAGDDPPQSIVAEGLLLKARVAMKTGASAEARTALVEASRIFGRLGERTRQVEAELLLGHLDLSCGDVTGARRRLESIRGEEGLDKILRGEANLLEAEIEHAGFGDPLRPALVAIDCFEQAGDVERAWRAHLRIAQLLTGENDEDGARRHLTKAADLEAQVTATVPEEFLSGLRADEDRGQLRKELEKLGPKVIALPVGEAARAAASRPVLRNERPRAAAVDEPPIPRDQVELSRRFPSIVWRSPAMKQVLELVERAAPADSLILIRGESGTGKELIADGLHRLGPRSARSLVKVNCAALVETLLMSELFGHEKGAFTGALQRRKGRFEAADKGTLFLDEIGDISPSTQVSLLRVLQEQQFERVGGSQPITTDVRIICATNRDLEDLVREGTFREDLYYRLKGIQIYLPPLRERPEDIEALAHHFLRRTAAERGEAPLKLSKGALAMLLRHPWPGNIRELENVMRSVSLFVDGSELKASHLAEFTELDGGAAQPAPPRDAAEAPAQPAAEAEPQGSPLEGLCTEVVDGSVSLTEMKKIIERECIVKALEQTEGNITQAASLLGMKRPRLSQLVKEHGLRDRDKRGQS